MRLTVNLVQLVVPNGWHFKQTTTLTAPTGEANVIASSEPLDPSVDTQHYAAAQLGALQREFPHFREVASGQILLGNVVPAVWRQFEWKPPDGVPVTQLQLYAVVGGRGSTATATTASTSWDRYEGVFHDVLRTMVVATH